MQVWVNGSQILSLAQVTDLEIVQGCITRSLTPHNDHCLPIEPADVMGPYIAHLEQELSRLDDAAWGLMGAERERMIVDQIEPLQKRLQKSRQYLEAIKSSSWDEFELPADPGLEGCFSRRLINARYRAEEVERFLPRQSSSPQEPLPPAAESKTSRSAYAQERNRKCREIAKRIWNQQPDFTIAAMVNHSEITRQARKPDGSPYSDLTIRNWIRDLCPNPKPGRRQAAPPNGK